MNLKIKEISSSPILRNFASVGFIQGLSLLLPLLTIPYLLVVLGAEGFAQINVALAVVTYFVVFTDYGFNLMGTRLITLHKNDPTEINRIFSNMLYAQFLLTIAAIFIFSILIISVPYYRENLTFFLATFGIVIGSTLLPTWYFQGREKFNQLHLINLIYRALYTVGIFLIITSKNDLLKVPLLNSATHILGGGAGLVWVMWRFQLRFVRWSWRDVFGFLKEGWNLFVSAISITSILQLPIIILAFFASATVVGFYAFAEKILLLFRILIQLFSTILYPRIIIASQISYSKIRQIQKQVRLYGIGFLVAAAAFLFFLPSLFQAHFPNYYSPTLERLLKIWSVLPLLIFLKIIAQQVLLAYDFTKIYARIMTVAALVNAVLLLILGTFLGYSGTALAVLLTECFLIFALQFWTRKKVAKAD